MWVKFSGILHYRNSPEHLDDYFLFSDKCIVSWKEDDWKEYAQSWLEGTNEFHCFYAAEDGRRYEWDYELNVSLPDDVRKVKIMEFEKQINRAVQMLRVLKG